MMLPSGDRVAKREAIGRFDATNPRECAHDVTNAGDREDENEAKAETLNAGGDLADAGAPHEVGKQQQTQQTENNAEWRESTATRAGFA
jgi:hypothetical protein